VRIIIYIIELELEPVLERDEPGIPQWGQAVGTGKD